MLVSRVVVRTTQRSTLGLLCATRMMVVKQNKNLISRTQNTNHSTKGAPKKHFLTVEDLADPDTLTDSMEGDNLHTSRVFQLPKVDGPTLSGEDLYNALMAPTNTQEQTQRQNLKEMDATREGFFASRESTHSNHLLRLTALRVQGNLADAKDCFEEILDTFGAGVQAYTTMIATYADLGLVENAISTLEDMKKHGLSPNLWTYTAIVSALVRGKMLDSAFAFVQSLTNRDDLVLDAVLFTPLLQGCLEARDVQRCWDTFNFMRRHHAEPDQVTFSVLMKACAMRGEAEKAVGLFDEMAQMKLIPTEVTYLMLMSCCAKRRDYVEQTFHAFNDMKDNGYTPNLFAYNTLMHACATSSDLDRANKVLREMEATGIQADTVTFNIFLDVLANTQRKCPHRQHGNNVKQALALVDHMATRKDVVVDIFTLNTVLAIVAEALFIRTAEDVVLGQLFPRFGVVADRVTYLIRARMFVRARKMEAGWRVAKEMEAKKLGKIDAQFITTLAHKCLGIPEKHKLAWEALSSIGVQKGVPFVPVRLTRQDSLQSMLDHEKELVFKGTEGVDAREQRVWADHLIDCVRCRYVYGKKEPVQPEKQNLKILG